MNIVTKLMDRFGLLKEGLEHSGELIKHQKAA
jgi:hypothetical protein